MAFETTRSSVLAIVEEVTEGVLVAPSAGTDCLPLSPGFGFSPNVETLENEEYTGTIAASPSIPGLESPTASFTNYAKGSGTAGVAADWDLVIKNAHGVKNVNSTERTTTTGSTAGSTSARAIVKLAAGGSDFVKGRALLIKDAVDTNSKYSIRNVHSVDTNDITLAQNLASAPATGKNVGKCITYSMSDSVGSLSAWLYRANGGAIEAISGVKTSAYTMNIAAGQQITFDWSFIGQSFYYNPVIVTASNNKIDFNIGAGEITATIPVATYRDTEEFRSAVEAAMNAVSADAISVVFSQSTGKMTVSTAGASLSILFLTGTNNANTSAYILGYTKTDKTTALTYTGENELSYSFALTPSYSAQSPLVAKSNELMIGSYSDYLCTPASAVTINFNKESSDVLSVCATSGKASTLFNSRTVSVDVVKYLQKHEIDQWLRFKNNTDTLFTYNCGVKSNGNWVDGTCVNIHSPSAKITAFSIGDENGIAVVNMTLACYSQNTGSEFFLNTL